MKFRKKILKAISEEKEKTLESVRGQVVGEKEGHPGSSLVDEILASGQVQGETYNAKKAKAQAVRLMQALEAEIAEIRKRKKEKERQSLRENQAGGGARQEAPMVLIEPASRPSRKPLGFGVGKTQAMRQQTRVEKPLPPSG